MGYPLSRKCKVMFFMCLSKSEFTADSSPPKILTVGYTLLAFDGVGGGEEQVIA